MSEEDNDTKVKQMAEADAPAEQKTFSGAEIKKRLKSKSKSELINFIVNLASRVDAHEAHKKEINQKVHDMDLNADFLNVQGVAELLNLINKEV